MFKFNEQFRKDHPETIGEPDSVFDLDNYKDWLEEQYEKTQWISVKDQMPPKNVDVLVLKKNKLKTIMCYFGIDGDYEIRWFSFGKWLDQTSQVTHWMRFPDAL